MAHTVIRLLPLLLLAIFSASPAAQPAATVEDEINQAEERLYAAMIAGDIDGVADLLADEFMFNQPGGAIATKASLLAQLKSGAVKVYNVERSDVIIHVYGTTASVMASTRLDRKMKSERRVVLMRSLDLWVLREGRWQLAARNRPIRLSLSNAATSLICVEPGLAKTLEIVRDVGRVNS